MKIMPKRRAKRLISVVLTVLFFVATALAIATTVFGIQSNIDVIDTAYGKLDKTKRIFTPNIDDIDIRELKKLNKISEWTYGSELGMKYSKLFKNSEKSIKRYNFEAENPDGSDFFKLSESQKEIVLRYKHKQTFRKPEYRKEKYTVDWSNVLFGKDPDGNGLVSMRKDRLNRSYNWDTIKQAIDFRRQELGTEAFDYDIATYDGMPFLADKDSIAGSLKEQAKNDVLSKKSRIFNIYARTGSDKTKEYKHSNVGVRLYEINPSGKAKLMRFDSVPHDGSYTISDDYEKYDRWYLGEGRQPDYSKTLASKTIEGIRKPVFLYGAKNTSKRVDIKMRHIFEGPNGEEFDYADLKNSSDTRFVESSDTMNLSAYNLYDGNFEKDKWIPQKDDYLVQDKDGNDKKGIGYELTKVELKKGTDINEITDNQKLENITEDGMYELTFRYSPKNIKLKVFDEKGNQITDESKLEELGLNKQFKFGSKVVAKELLGDFIFKGWKFTSTKNTEGQIGLEAVLDENIVSEDMNASITAITSETNERGVSLYFNYKAQNTKGDFEDIDDSKYKNNNIINKSEIQKDSTINVDNYITLQQAPNTEEYYATEYRDKRQSGKIIDDIHNLKINQTNYMEIEVRFLRKKAKINFNKTRDGENEYIDDSKFNSEFKTTVDIFYGSTLSDADKAKNAIGKVIEQPGVDSQLIGWIFKNSGTSINITEPLKLEGEIDLCAVWKQIVKLNVDVNLADQGNKTYAREDGNEPLQNIQMRLEGYKINDPSLGKLLINSTMFKRMLTNEIVSRIAERGWAEFDKIFDMNALKATVGGDLEVTLQANAENKIELNVDRKSRELDVEQSFEYSGGNVSKNIEDLKGQNNGMIDRELNGLGKLNFNLPYFNNQDADPVDRRIYRNNQGKYVLNMKDYVIKDKIEMIDPDTGNTGSMDIGVDSTESNYKRKPYILDKVAVNGSDKAYTEDEYMLNEGQSKIKLVYKYKPNKFTLTIQKTSDTDDLGNEEEQEVTHMDSVTLNTPTSNKEHFAFAKWEYFDGQKISDALLTKDGRFIMPGQNIKIKPVFADKRRTKVRVRVFRQKNYDLSDVQYPDVTSLGGKANENEPADGYTIEPQTDVDFTRYTQTTGNPVGDANLKGYEFDETKTIEPDTINYGSTPGTYKYTTNANETPIAYINVYFKKKAIDVRFSLGRNEGAGTLSSPLPANTRVAFGSKLLPEWLTVGNFIHNGGGSAAFDYWSLEDSSIGAKIEENTFKFNEESWTTSGVTLYPKWKNRVVELRAKRLYEDKHGNFVASTLNAEDNDEISLGNVEIGFDGGVSTQVKPNAYRETVYNAIQNNSIYMNYTFMQFDGTPIGEGGNDGSSNVEIAANKLLFTYKVAIKKITLRWIMPSSDKLLNAALMPAETEITIRYGAQMPSILNGLQNNLKYHRDTWETGYAYLKYWTEEVQADENAYNTTGADYHLADKIFDDESLFANNVQKIKNIYPVWGSIKNLTVRYKVLKEKAEFNSEYERWDVPEILSRAGYDYEQQLTLNDVDNVVRSHLSSAFNNEKGTWIVSNLGKANIPTLEVTVKVVRVKVRIELKLTEEDKTIFGGPTRVKETVNSENTILEYRYGQKPANKPSVQRNSEKFFKGWFYSGEYKFDGTREITGNMILSLERKPTLRVTLNMNNYRSDDVRYEDNSGNAVVLSKGINKIELLVVGGTTYTLQTLKGNFYDGSSHKPALFVNYSSSTVSGTGSTSVASYFRDNSDKYKGTYPQNLTNNDVDNNTSFIVEKFSYTVNYQYKGSRSLNNEWEVRWYKGVKYEKVEDQYFEYSKVELVKNQVEYPSSNFWTKHVIDAAFYNHDSGNETESGPESYYAKYVEIVRRKMGVKEAFLSKYSSYDMHHAMETEPYDRFVKEVTSQSNFSKYYAKATQYTEAINSNYQKVRPIPVVNGNKINVWSSSIVAGQQSSYHIGILLKSSYYANVPSFGCTSSRIGVTTWVAEMVIGYRLNIVF